MILLMFPTLGVTERVTVINIERRPTLTQELQLLKNELGRVNDRIDEKLAEFNYY